VLEERREKEVAEEVERQRAAAAKAAEQEYETQHKSGRRSSGGGEEGGVTAVDKGIGDLDLGEIPDLPKPAPGGAPTSVKPPGRSDYKSFGSVTKRQFPSVMALQNKTKTMFLILLLVHKLRVDGEPSVSVEEALGSFPPFGNLFFARQAVDGLLRNSRLAERKVGEAGVITVPAGDMYKGFKAGE
jgi:hypothetical protein